MRVIDVLNTATVAKEGRRHTVTDNEEEGMLYTIAIVLFVLWLLGYVSSYTMGGFLHVLLVLAIIMVLIRVIQGNRPV